ncbi:GGDEF domain-containing protein, partial [Acinetobacter baumannii]
NEHGIEKALELIEDERVNSVLEESEYEEGYKSLIRAKLYIEDGQKEKALEQLLAAEFEAEGNYEIQSLNVFKNKLYG